uniref:Uncharacterized protein n=1 Tax=Otus sunia TaxID=257818 RepID=A0A8C8EA72_9STRI
ARCLLCCPPARAQPPAMPTHLGGLPVSLGTRTALQEALSDKNPGPSCDLPSSIAFPQKPPSACGHRGMPPLRAGRGMLQSSGTEAKSSPDEEGAEDEDYQPHDARGVPPGCQWLGGHRRASAVPHQQRGVTGLGWGDTVSHPQDELPPP